MVLFQAVQATAALLLPTLNANIIDKGVLVGDVDFIKREGAIMLLVTLVQGACAATAVYFGSKVAMSFGRDLRAGLFHQVTDFSAREVGAFGAPSLITRITNDVQQVQMLVVMTCTMAIAAPITIVVGIVIAVREDPGLSVILAVAIPAAAVVLGVIVALMVPAFQLMQERIDQISRVHARADHRHPRGAGLRAGAAGGGALRGGQRRPHRGVAAGGPADVVDVPDRQPAHQPVERGRRVARRRSHRQR